MPDELAARLRVLRPWCHATREIDAQAMYFMDTYLLEAITGPTEDYLALSTWGHGINSYSLNYQLVYDGLAVFLQIGWGGAYMDQQRQSATLADWYMVTAQLLKASRERDRSSAGRGTVIVARSEFSERNICATLKQPVLPEDGRTWLSRHQSNGDSLFDAALAKLQA